MHKIYRFDYYRHCFKTFYSSILKRGCGIKAEQYTTFNYKTENKRNVDKYWRF